MMKLVKIKLDNKKADANYFMTLLSKVNSLYNKDYKGLAELYSDLDSLIFVVNELKKD